MSRVISDALQQIVRASQLGDVIVSAKTPPMVVTPSFTAILNIVFTKSITLLCTFSNGVQSFNQNNSPTTTTATLFTSGVDMTTAIDGSFAIEAVPAYTFVGTPDQENLLSTTGSFPALEAVPSFDVT